MKKFLITLLTVALFVVPYPVGLLVNKYYPSPTAEMIMQDDNRWLTKFVLMWISGFLPICVLLIICISFWGIRHDLIEKLDERKTTRLYRGRGRYK